MFLVRNQLVDDFEKETNVELLNIFVQSLSQSNHLYPEAAFLRRPRPYLPIETDGSWGRGRSLTILIFSHWRHPVPFSVFDVNVAKLKNETH